MEAEHDLLRLIGFENNLIDRIPRVHIDIDYSARLYFGEEIAVTVTVAKGDGPAAVGHLATHLATPVQLAWASIGSTGDLVPLGVSPEDIAALIDQIEAS